MDHEPLHSGSDVTSLPPDVLALITKFMDRTTVLFFMQMGRRCRTAVRPDALAHAVCARWSNAAFPYMIAPESMEPFVILDAIVSYRLFRSVHPKRDQAIIVRGDMTENEYNHFIRQICTYAIPRNNVAIIGNTPLSANIMRKFGRMTTDDLREFRIVPPPFGLEHVMFRDDNDFTLAVRVESHEDVERVANAISFCRDEGRRGVMHLELFGAEDPDVYKPIDEAWESFGPTWPQHQIKFL